MGGGPLTSPAGRGICARMVFVLCLLYDTELLTLLMLQVQRFYGCSFGCRNGSRLGFIAPVASRERGGARAIAFTFTINSARARASSFPRGAKCGQGLWRAGAGFSRVRLALGLSAGRRTQGSRKAMCWGVRRCACGRRARSVAGAVACHVLRVLIWSSCAGSVQSGRAR